MNKQSLPPRRHPRRAGAAIGVLGAVVALASGGVAANQSAPSTQIAVMTSDGAPGPASTRRSDMPASMPQPTLTMSPVALGNAAQPLHPRPAAPPHPAIRQRFAMNLFTTGDFVSQARLDWCVPAAIVSMINMIDRPEARRRPSPRELDRIARRLSSPRLRGAGSEPEGWARTLNKLGYGLYEVRSERTRTAAIRTAARAIRLTGRPVGLLVWRGAHAWVVAGFRATADPALTDDFEVTHLSLLDPLYPRRSSIWGASLRPNATVRVSRVAEDYLAWHRPIVRYPEKDGRFVLVVPVDDPRAVPRDR